MLQIRPDGTDPLNHFQSTIPTIESSAFGAMVSVLVWLVVLGVATRCGVVVCSRVILVMMTITLAMTVTKAMAKRARAAGSLAEPVRRWRACRNRCKS